MPHPRGSRKQVDRGANFREGLNDRSYGIQKRALGSKVLDHAGSRLQDASRTGKDSIRSVRIEPCARCRALACVVKLFAHPKGVDATPYLALEIIQSCGPSNADS